MQLTVSLAQIAVMNCQPQENLKKAKGLIAEAAKKGSQIICFPEMWTTGFNWANNQSIAREHEAVIEQVGELARLNNIWINGSMLALNEEGEVSNTSILFDAKGRKAGIYRKTHLFSFMHEDQHVAAGNSLCIADTPWGLVGLSICYDIRFPELFRTYALKGVKIVFSPMAFPLSPPPTLENAGACQGHREPDVYGRH